MITMIFNYFAWFVFVFIGVVWIMVLLKNRATITKQVTPQKKLPLVSIIIPAYNEGESVAKTIKSVLGLDYPRKLLDIIVVNDCSTDDTGKIANRYKKDGVRVFHNKVNKGKAFSLNRVMQIAHGDFVACVDADSVVEPNILKKMIGYFKDPNVGAVTPALKVWKTTRFIEKAQYAEYLLNIFLRKMLAYLDAVHVTPGVFSLYRKQLIIDIGGFDEDNLTEDMEITYRIHKKGFRIENDLTAISYTLCPDKWDKLFRQRLRWYRGMIQNTVKHRHIFFNKEYGNLGYFFFPANAISIIVIIIVFFMMAWSYISAAIIAIWNMNLIGWDFSTLIGEINIPQMMSQAFSTPFLLSMVGLTMGGYMLYVSFSMTGTNLKGNKRGFLMYLLMFPFIYIIFWVVSLIYEIFGFKRSW